MQQKKQKPYFCNMLMGLGVVSLTACGAEKHKPPAADTPETGTVGVNLTYPETVTGMLLGLSGTVEARQDLASDGGAPCSAVGEVVDSISFTPEDGLTEIAFALSVNGYCVGLADDWTMHYSDDGGATWSPAIPAADIVHTTDPHPVPVSVDAMGDEDSVTLSFDWTSPEVALGYGLVTVGFTVTANACSGECSADGEDGYMCVEFQGMEADCYPTCESSADCDPGFQCVKGEELGLGNGVCNGEAPESSDPDAGAGGEDAGSGDAGNDDAGASGGGDSGGAGDGGAGETADAG